MTAVALIDIRLRARGDGANGWSDHDLQDSYQLTELFLLRHGWSRAGRAIPTPGRVYQCGDEVPGEGACAVGR